VIRSRVVPKMNGRRAPPSQFETAVTPAPSDTAMMFHPRPNRADPGSRPATGRTATPDQHLMAMKADPKMLNLVPGAAQHERSEMMRCRPGTVPDAEPATAPDQRRTVSRCAASGARDTNTSVCRYNPAEVCSVGFRAGRPASINRFWTAGGAE